MRIDLIPVGADPPDSLNVIIEVPTGGEPLIVVRHFKRRGKVIAQSPDAERAGVRRSLHPLIRTRTGV